MTAIENEIQYNCAMERIEELLKVVNNDTPANDKNSIELVLPEVIFHSKGKEGATAMVLGEVRKLVSDVAGPLWSRHHGQVLCLVWLVELYASNITESILEVKGIDEVIYYSWEYSLDGEEWFAIGTMNEDPSIFEYRVAELLNLGTDITFRLTVNGIQSENTIHVTIQKIVMEVENPATDGDITNNYGNGDNITVDGNITENGTGDAITTDGNESEIGNNGTGEDVFTDNGTGETVITDNGTGETTGDEDAGFSEEIDDNGTDEGVPVTDDAGLFSGEEQDIEVIFTA